MPFGKVKSFKRLLPNKKIYWSLTTKRDFFRAMFCVSLFCNPVYSLFFQSIFYNLTGTITTTSLHLEDVLRSLCYLSAWLINLECHVMSMSKEVADGTMNGITITCWTIRLIYKISSDQTLLVALKNNLLIIVVKYKYANLVI